MLRFLFRNSSFPQTFYHLFLSTICHLMQGSKTTNFRELLNEVIVADAEGSENYEAYRGYVND